MQVNSVNLGCSGGCSGIRTGACSFKGSEADKSSSKKNTGAIAGAAAAGAVAAGALALGIYAYSKGKANSAEGAKISEIFKNGFTSIKDKVVGFKHKKVQTPTEVKEAAKAIENFRAPQNMDTLIKNYEDAVNKTIINPALDTMKNNTLHDVIYRDIERALLG